MSQGEKRKEEIIYAAMNVFSKNGFENSKMEAIALEAGIGKGTIYGYFSSKVELFEEMICFNMEEYKRELSMIIETQDSFSEKLQKWIDYHIVLVDENLDIFQHINSGRILSDSMEKRFIKEQNLFLKLIENMIQKAIENKEIRKNIDCEITALCILGGINHFTNKRLFIDRVDIDSIDSRALIDVLVNGLKK